MNPVPTELQQAYLEIERELQQARLEIDRLQRQVKYLERKFALANRTADQKALNERQKFLTALLPEVDPIRDRVLARMS